MDVRRFRATRVVLALLAAFQIAASPAIGGPMARTPGEFAQHETPAAVPLDSATLTVAPNPATLGTPQSFRGTLMPARARGVIYAYALDYGDGTEVSLAVGAGATPFTFSHTYAAVGTYTANVYRTAPAPRASLVAVTVVVTLPQTPRVPIGHIYSTSFTISPVLAGGETNVLIQWSAAVPAMGTILDPIEGYVDLLDVNGALVRRSDVFEISRADYAGPGVHTSSIPYDTPVDAHGTYQMRVVLFSAQGGTISVGAPATLLVLGGPDPEVKLSAQFHDTGSLEIGPHAGQPGATFDPGLTLGFLMPTYSGTLTGLFDPISRRSDPLLTIKSGAQTQIPAPDVAATSSPPPASAANSAQHSYLDVAGRGQIALPDALGGGVTLRGLDIEDTVGPTTYQAGYGYTQLGTAGTSSERGLAGDLNRTFGGDGNVRLTYFGRQDDPLQYPPATGPSGATGPLVTDSELLQVSTPTFDGFKLSASTAFSDAQGLLDTYRSNDAATDAGFTWARQKATFAFDYHNSGPNFAVGSGPSAASDRVGFTSTAAIPLGAAVAAALNYSKDETRDAFSRQSDAGATFNFTLPRSSTLALGATRDTQLAPTANTRTDGATAALGTHLGIGTLSLNAALSSTIDFVSPIDDAVSRTASLQYALQTNGHSLGIGINTTMLSGASGAPIPTASAMPLTSRGGNAQVGESLTYGFPFGGRLVGGTVVRGFELQLSGTNTSSHSSSSGGYDEGLSSILSYHLTSHLALGLRGEYDWHGDIVAANRHKESALRLRLDLTQ